MILPSPSTLLKLSPVVKQVSAPLVASAVSVLRGGAADVGRYKIRLDGLHTYSVITSLLLNASLRLYSATPKRFETKQHVRNLIKVVFSIAVTATVLAGSYTTIVFALIGLYTKRALGRGSPHDALVGEFLDQTKDIREVAYDTCLSSLVTFQIAFLLSLYLNHDEGMNWKISLGAAVAALACWWKWSALLKIASVLQL